MGKRVHRLKIYVSHPFGGKHENILEVEQIIKDLVKANPEHTYISPIHTFGYLYNDVDYETGLRWCIELLSVCDKMYVFGDWKRSRGCTAEVLYCEMHMIPYEIRRQYEDI